MERPVRRYKKGHAFRVQGIQWGIVLWIGLLSVCGTFGQGMDREEWKNRFEESFRKEFHQERIPAYVLQRMEQTLSLMQQEGWKRGWDPSRVASEASALARDFDEDLRRGVPPVQAGLLYRQMSQSILQEEKRGEGKQEPENRSTALDRLRERVKSRTLGKDKLRLWKGGGKPRVPSNPQGSPSDGSDGTGGAGGTGASGGSSGGGGQGGH